MLLMTPQRFFAQAVEKRHERRQDKAKFGEKAQFMVDK
jgi:hypothetical protein